ncbi:MAG TPA: DUF6259 domain-containing protein [Planctomycetota bacterium]|nr:DUF6259 domain-containing protein [Planctomycetota bacterium]
MRALVAAGVFAAAAGAQSPMAITWSSHSTFGPYISGVTNGTVSWTFLPEDLVKFRVLDTTAPASPLYDVSASFVTVSPGNANCTASRTGDVVTYSAPTYGFTATLTFAPYAGGTTVDVAVSMASTSIYAMAEIEAPRFKIQSKGSSDFAAHGYVGGAVFKNPMSATWNTGGVVQQIPMPSAMAFQTYWDAVSRDQLYVMFEDDAGYQKRFTMTGDGTSALWAWIHEPVNGRTAANGFVQPYLMRVEVFSGVGPDGRLGYYDAVERYRAWGASASRPWSPSAPWATSSDMSPTAASAAFHVDYGTTSFPVRATELQALNALIGFTDPLTKWNGWYNAPFGFDEHIPDFLPPHSAYEQALSDAQSDGWHVAAYENPLFWDADIDAGPFDPTAYVALFSSTFPDPCGPYYDGWSFSIYPYVCMNQVDAPYAPPSGWLALDPRNLIVAELTKNVLKRHYAGTSLDHPRGWYFDFFGGGGQVQNYGTPDATCTGCARGNDGKYSGGKRLMAAKCRESITECDAAGYTMTESSEESLIQVVDLHGTTAAWGKPYGVYWLFPSVYGDLQRSLNIVPSQIDDTLLADYGPGTGLVGAAEMIAQARVLQVAFHATGMLSLPRIEGDKTWIADAASYVLAAGPGNTAPFLANPHAIPLFAIKAIHDRLSGYRPFVEGRRLRPLPNSWEGDFVDADLPVGIWSHTGGAANVMSSLWSAADGTVGLLVTNLGPATGLDVQFDPALYGMSGPNGFKVERWDGATWKDFSHYDASLPTGCSSLSDTQTFYGTFCGRLPVDELAFEVYRFSAL